MYEIGDKALRKEISCLGKWEKNDNIVAEK